MSETIPAPPQKPIPPTPPIKPIPPQKNKGQKIKKKTGTAAVVSPSVLKGHSSVNASNRETTLFYPSLYGGRFTRDQFWSYQFRILILSTVFFWAGPLFFVPFSIFYELPVTVKRIHDLGYSAILPISIILGVRALGVWALDNEMLIIGFTAVIILLGFEIWIGFFDSQEGANSYGDSIKYPDLLVRMRQAISTDDSEQILRLIKSGGVNHINKLDKEGRGLLHTAAKNAQTRIVKLLIAGGADVNKVDNARYTPLQWAAYNKHKEIVELLKQQRTASKQNYTAFLSDTYPSFAGVATKTEFRSAFWSLVTLDYLWKNFTICVKRFHAFGWSYTYCNLFPSIMLGLIGLFFFGYGFAEEDTQYLIIGSVITPILYTIYFLIIGGVCFFGNAHIDTCGNSNDDKINKYKNLPIRCAYVLLPLCVLGSVVFFELPCIKPSIQQNKAEIKLRKLGYEDSYKSHRIEEKDNDDIMKLKIAARWISPSEAFHKAISDNNVELMKFLIEKGADVNKTNEDGETPLYWAAANGHSEIVKLLVEAGADVNKTTEVGWTPLHTAAGYGHTEVVKLLIEAGAVDKDVNKTNKYGITPLYWAAENGRTEAVKWLIEAGADVNKAAEGGTTPLYWASYEGHTEIVKLLIEAGADVNKASESGWTPLYWAARYGYTEIVKLLIEAGADVNKADNDGQTPLYSAAVRGHTEIVKLLIEEGADVNKAHNNGATPLYEAARYGYTEIVELLKQAGAKMYK